MTPAAQDTQTLTGTMRPAFLLVPELPQLKARRDEELDSLTSLRIERDLVEAQIELGTLDTQTKRYFVEAQINEPQTKLAAQTDRDLAEATILESAL